MRRCLLAGIVFFALTACEKEYSNEFGSPGAPPVPPTSSGDLLVSAVLKDDVSELRYVYDYNAGRMMIKNTGLLTSSFLSGDFITSVSRDASGRIQTSKLFIKTTFNPLGDSVFYSFFRNSSGKVAYTIVKSSLNSSPTAYDSMVYTYTAGKLSGFIGFYVSGPGGIIEPFQKLEFTYTGANVTKAIDYELFGNLTAQKVTETITMQYDTKPAAYPLSEDDYIAGLIPINLLFPCVNNITKIERTYEDPDENTVTTYAYTYGSNNRPATSQVTTQQIGQPEAKGTLTFTYQ